MKDLSNIKCIVLSGGGAMFYQMLGIFNELINNNINIDNITHIYGCSAGAILAVTLSLGYDFNILKDYFIDRPWHKLIKTDIFQLLSSYNTCGIIGKDIFIKAYDPLFKGKDMDISTITLQEFYDKTKKELHIYCTNITDGEIVDLSYITHPEWLIIDALQATACLPTIIVPVIKNNKCYIDGGIINNFPSEYALKKFDNNEIIGIKTEATIETNEQELNFDNILDFLTYIVFKSHSKLMTKRYVRDELKNIFIIKKDSTDCVDIFSVLNSKDKRNEYFEQGKIICAENI